MNNRELKTLTNSASGKIIISVFVSFTVNNWRDVLGFIELTQTAAEFGSNSIRLISGLSLTNPNE